MDTCVNCTDEIAVTCVYGKSRKELKTTCNYMLIEGKPRGCKASACDKYEPITEDNPRKYTKRSFKRSQTNLFVRKD